jgi:preprotein translocase subunit YajC
LAEESLVQLNSGLIGVVKEIEKDWILLESEGGKNRYAKSAICKVLKTELKKGERVRTTSGIIGTIDTVTDDVVTIVSGKTTLEIDRKAICEVLPPPPKVK